MKNRSSKKREHVQERDMHERHIIIIIYILNYNAHLYSHASSRGPIIFIISCCSRRRRRRHSCPCGARRNRSMRACALSSRAPTADTRRNTSPHHTRDSTALFRSVCVRTCPRVVRRCVVRCGAALLAFAGGRERRRFGRYRRRRRRRRTPRAAVASRNN